MYGRVNGVTVVGVRGRLVAVEAHVGRGLPSLTLTGLPGAGVQDARDRIRPAVESAGLEWPLRRVVVNFAGNAALLVGPSRTLVRTYYYTCRLTPDHAEEARKAQEKFLGALDHIDYLEVRLGKLVRRDTKCVACGDEREKWMEKGVDMRLGVDMLAAAAKDMYDTAVLVSGDGDIAEAVKAVKELGRQAEVAAFPRTGHMS